MDFGNIDEKIDALLSDISILQETVKKARQEAPDGSTQKLWCRKVSKVLTDVYTKLDCIDYWEDF